MLSYMDLIQNCFFTSTGWSWDNTYEHILATPKNLLHFQIPNGVNIVVSNRNTENNYSSLNISQVERVEGSLSYLSSSANLDNLYQPSSKLPISNLLQGYRYITTGEVSDGDERLSKTKPFLLYGKMYFPSQFIEGMLIKRFSPTYQLLVKFVNTPKLNKLTQPTSIFTFYLQRQTKNYSHDFIYSTREDLLGFRCLYHVDLTDSQLQPSSASYSSSSNESSGFISSKFRSNITNHPSTLSAGCELWYSIGSVSPGVSMAVRYTTYLDSMRYLMNNIPSAYSSTLVSNHPAKHSMKTGERIIESIPYAISSIHPLTFTLAMNPLLGTVESTYAIRSDGYFKGEMNRNDSLVSYMGRMGLVLSSKYQFNMYSYDSDLILGAQILRSKLSFLDASASTETEKSESTKKVTLTHHDLHNKTKHKPYKFEQQHELIHKLSNTNQHNVVYKVSDNEYTESNVTPPITDIPEIKEDIQPILPVCADIQDDEYISSLKISGNVTKQNVRVAWEGKFYDWFISAGTSMDMKGASAAPRVLKYGVEFAYNA